MTPKFKQPGRALGEKGQNDFSRMQLSRGEIRAIDIFMGKKKLPANFWHINKTGKKKR